MIGDVHRVLDLPPFAVEKNDEPGSDFPERAVLSTRVRLARNHQELPFPGRASIEARNRLWGQTLRRAALLFDHAPLLAAEIPELSDLERTLLVERRLATADLVRQGAGSGVIVSQDARISLMVNEEDHFRIQVLLPGLQIPAALEAGFRVDNALCREFPVAFSEKLGFLTACPTNVGTGLRASVMMHLPGLGLGGQLDAVERAVRELGMTLRGPSGEGSEPVGYLCQISNQSTLGESETAIIDRLERLVRALVWHERNARLRLVRRNRSRLYDYVGRALGLVRYAARLSVDEALESLAALRLGAVLGLLPRLPRPRIERLWIEVQPAHLALRAEAAQTAPKQDQDEFRAAFLRQNLAEAGAF